MRAGSLALSTAALLFCQSSARANEDAASFSAEALFAEGRALRARGQIEEACAKFEASARARPAVGTWLNLADCALSQRRLATAWLRLRRAERLAIQNGDDKRREEARAQAEALEPRLPRILMRIEGAASLRDPAITWDGASLDPSVVGTPWPVDAGPHRVVVSATGRKAYAVDVEAREGAVVTVVIPPLLSAAEPGRPRESERPGVVTHRASPWPWLIGATGVAAGALGGILFAHSRSVEGEVVDACPNGRCPDKATYDRMRSDQEGARTEAVIAAVAAGTGGALLGTAVFLLLRTSGEPAERAGSTGRSFTFVPGWRMSDGFSASARVSF